MVVAEAQALKEDREGDDREGDDRVADALSEDMLADIPMQDEGETNLGG